MFSGRLPLKANKRGNLHSELKKYNREINKIRIGIEHVFGRLKIFKILAGRYRNWTAPSILDTRQPHFEAASKANAA